MQRNTPRLIEVVGPAGSGKSTLCSALASSSDCIHLNDFPDVHKTADAPFFILHGLRVLPGVLGLPAVGARRLTRREFAWLSILEGWPGLLQNELRKYDGAIVLDQGPVYLLTELFEFGPESLKSRRAEGMLHALSGRWALVLDMIVWLDAPDAVLLERIRSRDKEHVVKNESEQAVFEFLDEFRTAYEHTLARFTTHRPDLSILRFDTSKVSPLQIADQLWASIQ